MTDLVELKAKVGRYSYLAYSSINVICGLLSHFCFHLSNPQFLIETSSFGIIIMPNHFFKCCQNQNMSHDFNLNNMWGTLCLWDKTLRGSS